MTCVLRSVTSLLRTVKSLYRPYGPWKTYTDCTNWTDRKINKQTVTVRVYWTTLHEWTTAGAIQAGTKCGTPRVKRNWDWVGMKTNMPEASHMGGAWECQIRTVQNVLASILTQHAAQLDNETLRTFTVEAKAIVNWHPLTVDTINSSQMPEPLMPNHLPWNLR